MLNAILDYFSHYNFDIRITNDARFMDQKVTPDVLSIISDCVINFINENNNELVEFTTKDIWNFKYSNENVKAIFNKPDVLDISAKSEFDKFFQQPLKMLSYAKILDCNKKSGKNYFRVKNKEILSFISLRERNALNFLNIYLKKVLSDSELWMYFELFFNENNKQRFSELKSQYEDFILSHTPINGRTEIRRIFTKVLNPLAYEKRCLGTVGGSISKNPIDYAELMYNRRNWRDVSKLKNETREQYEARAKKEVENTTNAYVRYTIQKAKNIVRSYSYPTSEVKDEFANDIANHVHHIFMSVDYPSISSYPENMILLTANQHLTHAHPENNTKIINRDYQLICLTSKSETIEKSIEENKYIYSKEDFLTVIKVGLNKEIDQDSSFNDIREQLVNIYNEP